MRHNEKGFRYYEQGKQIRQHTEHHEELKVSRKHALKSDDYKEEGLDYIKVEQEVDHELAEEKDNAVVEGEVEDAEGEAEEGRVEDVAVEDREEAREEPTHSAAAHSAHPTPDVSSTHGVVHEIVGSTVLYQENGGCS